MAKNLKHWGLAVFVLLIGPACESINKITVFNLKYTTQATVQSAVGINLPFNLLTPSIKTNSESAFEINETRKDLVEEIKLTSLQIAISIPENGDFTFLKSIKIYISGNGVEEKLIAWNEAVDTDKNYIDLATVTDDLQEYIKLDSVSLRVNTVTKKLLLTDYLLDINAVFRVDAKILGI